MPPRSTVATAAIPGMQYTRATPDTTFFNSLLAQRAAHGWRIASGDAPRVSASFEEL